MSTPYAHADKAIKAMYDEMEREFQNISVMLRFDELNVVDVKEKVGDMYKRIDSFCKKRFKEVAENAYRDAKKECRGEKGKLESGFVGLILMAFHPTTKYVYRNEWNRKRDRLCESLMSSRNRLELRQMLRRTLNLTENQVRQYADIVTDEARLDAFIANGHELFKWNSMQDDKVCGTCSERDGQVYRLDEIPEKHPRCRCYLTPAD